MSAVTRDSEPWFVATDICKALEISNNHDALSRLDADEKGVISTDTLGGKQEMSIVSEPGLYSLVLGSRKPEAERPQEVSKTGAKVPREIILDTFFDTLKI